MVAVQKVGERYFAGETTPGLTIWRRFRRSRLGMLGLLVLLLVVASVVMVPIISPFGYDDSNEFLTYASFGTFSPMSGHAHLLGTDRVGRDVATRLFLGGEVSLVVGFSATVVALLLGALVGVTAGFFGGWVDTLLMRVVDFMLALPLVPACIVLPLFITEYTPLTSLRGNEGWWRAVVITITLALFGWMGLARQVRASVLTLRTLDYIEASRALGSSGRRIIFRHLLPNSITPMLVVATLSIGDFVIFESILSYLGRGIEEPLPSLGNLLQESQSSIWVVTTLDPTHDIRAYLMLLPAMLLLTTVLAINTVGEALRQALDPQATRT